LGARPTKLMRQYELVERVLEYNPHADEALLNKAYVYGMQKHGSQLRASGDPYFAHPLEVAAILTDLKLDDATIAVALLHDTIEDTDATRAEIDQLFGPEIGAIVDGLTKIERLNLVSREEAQAENLRKLLLAISQDVRVLLVKLADRLHNMRTIDYVPPDKRQRIAQETMDIYAPLAGRMGMQDMRSELEDISFRVLQPEHYETITARLAEMEGENRDVIEQIQTELTQKLEGEGIAADVTARLKSPWSIFRKIEQKAIALEQLSDIIGFRILVDSADACYRTLGVVHTTWKMVPGRFKDYVSVPKYNDYRSIHTTIVGPGRHRAELQIRTRQMHQIAEFGIAAHALYKDKVSTSLERLEQESQAYSWLRTTISHLTEGTDTDEFLEHTKLELFQDQVFCFTPRGRLIALPRGATPIDFAYAVHTDIGDTCVGAKINGVYSPIVTQLRNGDEVEVIRDHNHSPAPNWESIAVTGKARAAVRRALRAADQRRARALGEQVMSMLLQQHGLEETPDFIANLARDLGLKDRDDVVMAIGEGRIDSDDLQNKARSLGGKRPWRRRKLRLPVPQQSDGWFSLRAAEQFKFRLPGGQKNTEKVSAAMSALDFNTPVRVSPEGVLPGDRIVGILAADTGITVYPIHSDALTNQHDADVVWVDTLWDIDQDTDQLHQVTISMLAADRTGMLAQVSSTIATHEANIHNLVLRMVSPDFHQLLFQLEVRDLAQLTELMTSLRQMAGLSKVMRATYDQAGAVTSIDWQQTNTGKTENRPMSVH